MQAEQIKKSVSRWHNDPVLFAEEVLGITTLQQWQKDALYDIRDNERISIKACHDVGKTYLMAIAFLWFFITRENSIVLTTAPSWPQVEKLLWAEINNAINRAPHALGGRCLLTEYKISDKWYAIGLSPKIEVNTGSGQGTTSHFQGYHAPSLMVIFDEATGVRPQIWTLAEGNLTSGETKFVAIGNPTSRSCNFYDTFKDMTWKNIAINCFISPNLHANGIKDKEDLLLEYARLKSMTRPQVLKTLNEYKSVNPYLLSMKWVMSRALKWGIDHPLFVSKALGDFPEEDDNALIPLAAVERAQQRQISVVVNGTRFVGIDCARFGADKTVFTEFIGDTETRVEWHTKADGPTTVDSFIAFIKSSKHKVKDTFIAVDGGAMGGTIIDFLRVGLKKAELRNVYVSEIQFGARFDREQYPKGSQGDKDCKYDKKHYADQKAKMFWHLADDIKSDKVDLLDNLLEGVDDIYQDQLPDVLYGIPNEKITVESKDDYKKRTGKPSPDFADSLALARYASYIKGAKIDFSKFRTHKKKTFTKTNSKVNFLDRGLKKFKIKV